ncbi:hypothetical protein ACLB2K_048207 [Fragaria x ananassa]
MIILAEYDGLTPVEDVSLNHLKVWVSIVRLRFAMRNNKVPSRVANGLGVFVRAIRVERAHGICKDYGFFGHGGGTCDKGLICGLSVVDAVSAVDGEPELLASRPMEVVGLVKEPVLQVEKAVPTGLEDIWTEWQRGRDCVGRHSPDFLNGKP